MKFFAIVILFFFSWSVQGQFELRKSTAIHSATFITAAGVTYVLGGIPNQHQVFSIDPDWGESRRLYNDNWHKASYGILLTQGLMVGVLAFTQLEDRNDWITGAAMAAHSASVTYLVTQSVKAFIPRYRPYVGSTDITVQPDDLRSFWSGTSAISMTIAGFGVAMSNYYLKDSSYKILVQASLVTLGGMAMTSRVLAGKHHVSDVLVGGMVGFASGYFIPRLYRVKDDSKLSFTGTGLRWTLN